MDNVNRDVLDYGTVGVQEQRSLTFRIINDNPVEVSIKEFGTQFEFARLRLMHVLNLKKSSSQQLKNIENQVNDTTSNKTQTEEAKDSDDLVLKSSDVATFKVDIVAPEKEGTYHGHVSLRTLYEVY